MEEWKTYKLGELAQIKGGKRLPKGVSLTTVSNTHPYIRIRDLGSSRTLELNDTFEYVDDATQKTIARYIVNSGDVLLSIVGTIGLTGIVGRTLDKANLTENCVKIVGTTGVSPKYLYYFLSSPIGQSEITKGIVGAVQPKLPIKNIQQISIPLPPLAAQERIVDILSTIDDKIELNNRINHNLEEQAQALYKSWFVDFEPFKGGNFVDSELGLIPEGWRVGTLSELGDIVAGGTPSKTKPEYYTNNGIAWLTPKDLSVKCNKFTARGEIDITEDGYKNSSAKLMPRGSVLFSSRAPIGYISIAKGGICTNQGFKSVVPTYAGTAYLYYWLCENTEAIEAQASGSTFKEASGSLMRSFPALVPEKSVIDSFEKELSPIHNEQEVLEEEINHAEQIRDSLLPRLMSGELFMNC